MNAIFPELARWLDMKAQPKLEGWASLEKAEALAMTAFVLRPHVAVEIGVWAGRSALPVALAMRECGQGTLHCIDPWKPEASAEGYDEANREWWLKHANHEYAKRQFLELIQVCRLQSIIEIHCMTSDDFPMHHIEGAIDLLHVDGQHTFQAIKDVAKFAARVRIGGIVFMDDCSWENKGEAHVRKATDDLQAMGFAKLYGCYGQTQDGHANDFECWQRIK